MDKEKLFYDNINLAYEFSKKYQEYYGKEDAIQISLMGFWVACKTFNPDKGIKLSTYAYKVMSNRFFLINRNSKKIVTDTVSLDRNIKEDGDDDFSSLISDDKDYEEICINNICLKNTIEYANKNLNPTDKFIFNNYFLNNESQMKIAEDLDISQAQVSRRISNIRNILRRGMGYD